VSAAWIASLEADAPDVVACWRRFTWDAAGVERVRHELQSRVDIGDAPRLLAQQEAIGDALEAVLRSLPDRLLRAPGGEEDWNVAQAFAHTTAARRFLGTWAALDVDGSWPEHRPPTVIPSIPGPPDASRDRLLTLLDKSRRAIREAAARIEGHETQPCRIVHPLVGHLRCGDWLLFLGIHDLMHLEQLHRLRETDANAEADAGAGPDA
jgi:hypothetical protein